LAQWWTKFQDESDSEQKKMTRPPRKARSKGKAKANNRKINRDNG